MNTFFIVLGYGFFLGAIGGIMGLIGFGILRYRLYRNPAIEYDYKLYEDQFLRECLWKSGFMLIISFLYLLFLKIYIV